MTRALHTVNWTSLRGAYLTGQKQKTINYCHALLHSVLSLSETFTLFITVVWNRSAGIIAKFHSSILIILLTISLLQHIYLIFRTHTSWQQGKRGGEINKMLISWEDKWVNIPLIKSKWIQERQREKKVWTSLWLKQCLSSAVTLQSLNSHLVKMVLSLILLLIEKI